jgi:hypothetical protein
MRDDCSRIDWNLLDSYPCSSRGNNRSHSRKCIQDQDIPRRKTYISDSEWLAELGLNVMVEPSWVFPKDDRELRMLTRAKGGMSLHY